MIAIYPLIVIGLMVAALRRPATAVGGILCLFGLEQWAQSQSAFFVQHGIVTNLIIGGIGFLALLAHVMKGEKVFGKYPPVGWVVLGLYIFVLLSVIWSADPKVAFGQWLKIGPLIILIVFLAPLLIVQPRDLRDALLTTLVLGSLVLLLLLLSHRTGRAIVLESLAGSAAQKGNPLAIGTLSAYVVLIAMLVNFSGFPRFWGILRWLIVALGLVTLIMSESRGQLAALLFVALAFLPLSRRPKNPRGFAMMIAGVSLAVLLTGWAFSHFATSVRWTSEALRAAYLGGAYGDQGRLALWRPLLDYWINSSPLYWIVGLGNSASFDIIGFYPHFVLLEILMEEGLVGVAMFCAILLMTLHSLQRLTRWFANEPEPRGLVAVVGALFCLEVLLSCKEGSFLGNVYLLAFAIIIARFEWAVWQRLRSAGPVRLSPLDMASSTPVHPASPHADPAPHSGLQARLRT